MSSTDGFWRGGQIFQSVSEIDCLFYIFGRDNFCLRTHSVIWKKHMFYFGPTTFFQKMEYCFFTILAVAGFH
jgi:hypothetical protein